MGYKSFAVTVIGRDHTNSGVCQDASAHYYDESSNVAIAVVADGHGDGTYFRSDTGARLAAECAIEGIKSFVKDSAKLFEPTGSNSFAPSEPPSLADFNRRIREKLIDPTVRSWKTKAEEHCTQNPFTEKELENVKEKYRVKFENGEDVNKAYGTTLIAAVITQWYWFAYHAGDGRFSVLYPDGNGEQPVFWDDRCFLNSTTSLCDDDILQRTQVNHRTGKTEPVGVRLHLSFHTDRPPPIAFFLCTDGIDDNYPVMENEKHLYRLYRTISVGFAEKGYEANCGKDGKSGSLEHLAKRFATEGKGDDTSIAGFVNIEELQKVAPAWKENIEKAEVKRAEEKKAAEEEAAIRAAEAGVREAEAACANAAKFAQEAAKCLRLANKSTTDEATLDKLVATAKGCTENVRKEAETAAKAAARVEKIASKIAGETPREIQLFVDQAKHDAGRAPEAVYNAEADYDKIKKIANARKSEAAAKKPPPAAETKAGVEVAVAEKTLAEEKPAEPVTAANQAAIAAYEKQKQMPLSEKSRDFSDGEFLTPDKVNKPK